MFGQASRGTLAVTTKMAFLAEIAAVNNEDDDELNKEILFAPEYRS